MHYKKMVIAVGAFITISVLLIALGIGYIVQKKGIFEKKYHYRLLSQSGADLTEGMPVEFSGFEIGMVVELKLTSLGHVEILIEIPEHQVQWLKVDSVFVLDKPLIGSSKIQVVSQNLSSKPLSVDEERPIITSEGIDGLIAQFQPILYGLQGILNNVNIMTQADSDIQKILHHTEVTAQKISRTKAVVKLDQMIAELQVQLLHPDTGMVAQVSQMIEKAQQGILGEKDSSLATVNAMLEDIAQKVKRLDTTIDSINASSGDVNGMTKDVKFTLQKTDRLIEGLNGIIGSSPEGEVSLP